MPICRVPNHPDLKYYLLSFTAEGIEREDDPDTPNGVLSGQVAEILATRPVTDLFLMSHGWKGDEPAAVEQYDRWIGAMAECAEDRKTVQAKRPGFEPLLVGLHWPSLPWGDERVNKPGASFSPSENSEAKDFVNEYSERIADTPIAREALSIIFEAALEDVAPARLPSNVRQAYLALNKESGLGSELEGAPPGADRELFNPENAYHNALFAAASFGATSLDGILSPLRQLSFWKMKDRARRFGESGGHQLLRTLQQVARQSGCDIRCHLMGHSFGCIVVSSILRGPDEKASSLSSVDSLFLAQGALSLWSYCESIPHIPDRPGYFRSIVADRKVKGPIVATLSEHDRAVGKFYPLGAGVAGQIAYAPAEFPKYGGVGTFGARGAGIDIEDVNMLDRQATYDFRPGKFYNLDASAYISQMDGASGAHNDIARPEVAHAFWQAALA
jgi:hypothetical protein